VARRNVLVLACGALAREVLAIVRRAGWEHVEVRCLPASLHSAPQEIPRAVARELEALAGRYEHVFVAYADCGTVGALDRVLAAHGAERLEGAHCYRRLVYLAQTDDAELRARAEDAARRLGLEFVHRPTGYGDLLPTLTRFVDGARAA